VQQAGIGTINIVDSTPIALAVTYPDPYSATLTTTLDTQAAASVFAGPETGADTAPTFRAIVPGDLPDATASTKGIMQPGTGLAVDAGTLNHSNTVSGTTISSITFDDQGHITAAVPLVAADIPDLDVSKIATGEFSTVRYADASITASKIADYANAQIGETLPVADHIGQFFFNPLEGSVYLWDGNVWQPVGVTTGAIAFAGTFDASAPSGIGQVATVTSAGAAVGLVAGSGLPAASLENSEYYLVVSSGGTITTGNAPFRTLAPPDLILSDGTAWVEVDVSTGAGAIAASNVSFSSGGDISATSVQSAIEEVSTECRNADNITSGTLAVARGGTGLASYAKGDLIAASGTTTLAKLPVGTNTHVLRANSSTATGLEWGADFTGTVTTVSSATAALTVATSTTTPALTIRSATTSVNGIVQLSDSTSTTSSILAATPTAVKSAYDLAALALPKAGGTVTGDITLGANIGIQFEGTTDDANEIRLIGADATADRTITLPNATGTVVLSGAIVNADINASAAIADTKLATISTAGKVSGSAITSGTIATSGELQITNTSPAIRLTESDGTSTHSQTLLSRSTDQFFIQTRDSTGTLVSSDYVIPADASGATDHVWRIADTEKARLNSSGLTVVDDLTISDKIVHASDTNTAIRFPAVDTVTVETGGSERLRIASAGNVGIGTTSPGAIFHTVATSVAAATVGAFLQNSDNTAGTEVRLALGPAGANLSDNRYAWLGCVNTGGVNGTALTFATGPGGEAVTEKARIDSSGRLLVGTSSSVTAAGIQPTVQNIGTSLASATSLNVSFNADITSGGSLYLGKSKNATTTVGAIVANGDRLGTLRFVGDDGAALINAAGIDGVVDGTPGTNDMPGRLVFSTTADGSASPTERMRIDNQGRVGFNSSSLGGTNGAYRFAGNITGATGANGIRYTPTILSDATVAASVFLAEASTASNGGTPYTLGLLRGFLATQGTFNADSTVADQRGFEAPSTLTGATNNYGFFGNLASATGRWNFYANGSAPSYFVGDVRTNTAFTARAAPANSNTSATATASSLKDGLRTGTPTDNITLTLPTGTDMDSAFQELQTNQSFEWSVINLAAATHVITVVAASGHTAVGNMAVAAATSGRFITRKTAANTFISYRIA
jgi:hypothetical protein